MRNRIILNALAGIVAVAAAGLPASRAFSASETTVSALAQKTHFHGIAVNPGDPSQLYLATHHGLFQVGPDGKARRISKTRDDFMGFTPHPTDASILYASGHPVGGGNLGFIASRNGGMSWTQISRGVRGPVDFHQMDVSRVNPKVIYGIHGGLQVSRDSGRNWRMAGPAPEGLIDFAASAKDVNVLYAATKEGLLKSKDTGRSWQSTYILRRPVTMVQTSSGGGVYAFVVGTGLIRTMEPGLNWHTIGDSLGDAYILHLAVDPTHDSKLYAVTFNPKTRRNAVLASGDGGRSWLPLGSTTKRVK
jgi:photosystem II stability/assembly factor-like uncharacterized protein